MISKQAFPGHRSESSWSSEEGTCPGGSAGADSRRGNHRQHRVDTGSRRRRRGQKDRTMVWARTGRV
ncbi:hypothetical protein CNE_1c10370 [Cupriavidus necator N-1]|uniref:Uncharacterized protein n=1 Tax=Cupriavidus necator (strain ATCC 43291 / DSM 13513 / CCUG 52238 / LMG 8453 / N-1) TaxID=1042878 RepID=G0F0A8_CUPNN|nr:hypothetical protein CNE_1c10370 [Cupriavidus necator N-1]KAI3596272.1 hypothetical protein D8I24_7466 [Cupriavidus necator H850]